MGRYRMKNRIEKDGVSPVVATILLVAITVLLTAVLYYMVIGFGGDTAKPTVGLQPASKVSAKEFRIQVAEVTPSDVLLTNYKVMVLLNGSLIYNVQSLSTSLIKSSACPSWASVTFTDLTNNSRLSKGDYFAIKSPMNFGVGITFEIKILWTENESELVSKVFLT